MSNYIIGILQIALACGFIGFWIYFFLIENKQEKPEIYFAFERSFPFADLGWITPILIIAAIGNLLDLYFANTISLVASGSLIFLGILDFTFNVQHHNIKSRDDLIFSFAINIVCLISGIIFLIFAW
ncbi:MAG: hypothetical protein ACTSQO_00760 [Candidatus Helarchaeota archaeon]